MASESRKNRSILDVEVVQLRGTAYEIGVRQGQRIRRKSNFLNWRRFATRLPSSGKLASRAKSTITRYAPSLWEEFEGFADGVQAPINEVLLRIGNFNLKWPASGCSSLCTPAGYVYNYDFSPRLYDRRFILTQMPDALATAGFSELVFGRLVGLNERGLCAGLHCVNRSIDARGLFCALILRIVLDRCESTEEAIKLLQEVPHGKGYNYSLFDAKQHCAVVEASPKRVRVRSGEGLGCANHFTLKQMRDFNRSKPDASIRRLRSIEDGGKKLNDLAQLYGFFRTRDSPAFQYSYNHCSGTLHTMAIDAKLRLAYIGIASGPHTYELDFDSWVRGGRFKKRRLSGVLPPSAKAPMER